MTIATVTPHREVWKSGVKGGGGCLLHSEVKERGEGGMRTRDRVESRMREDVARCMWWVWTDVTRGRRSVLHTINSGTCSVLDDVLHRMKHPIRVQKRYSFSMYVPMMDS